MTGAWGSGVCALGLVLAGVSCAGADKLFGSGGGDKPVESQEPEEEAVWQSVAGDYQTTYGLMTIVEDGKNWTGTYPGGTIRCSWTGVRGTPFDCDYQDGSGAGKATMWYVGGFLRGRWQDGAGVDHYWRFGPADGPVPDGSTAPAEAGGGGGGDGCSNDADCGPGNKRLCDGGQCIIAYGACDFDSQCRGGAKCKRGERCADSEYGSCDFDADCGSGRRCKSKRCE